VPVLRDVQGRVPGNRRAPTGEAATDHCATLMALFEHFERKILELRAMPLSLSPERPAIEGRMLTAWAAGNSYRA
jgi:hypothetical protein